MTAFIELAEEVLQVDTYAILGSPDGEGDDFLRVADQNPNRAGCELVLEAYSIYEEGPDALRKAADDGSLKHLILVGTDYPNPGEEWLAALDKLETVIAFTSNWDDTAKKADLVIPMASYAEQDGTFVNIDGRMQRVNRAMKPIAGRKTPVELVTMTVAALGMGDNWNLTTWTAAFSALRKHTNLLEGVRPTQLGPWGVALDSELDASDRISRDELTDDEHQKATLKVVQ